MRRVLWLGGVAVVGTLAVCLSILLPELNFLIPRRIRARPNGALLVCLIVAHALGRLFARRARRWPAIRDRLSRLLDRGDSLAGYGLGRGLSIFVGSLCLCFLATWLPHYLLWPWGRDADTFATLAQSWDAGIRPYRDIRGYNFPGAIYLFWLLGKIFGWGRTWSLYAIDSAGLLLLGGLLAAWSRRCLGRRLPGLASYLLFLTFYLNHNFELVAQRDWHTSLCVALALLVLEGWPGQAVRILAAALVAAAISIRPHAILFLPALSAAVLEGHDRTGPAPNVTPHSSRRRLAVWFLALVSFTTLAFAPVVLQGLADDLVRGLGIAAYGGAYNRATFATAGKVCVEQLRQPGTSIAIATLGLLLSASRGATRMRALTWALALGAAFIYRPVHPVQHRYLGFPLEVIGSIAVAPSIGWIIDRERWSPLVRMGLAILVVGQSSPGFPIFCNPAGAVDAILTMAHGESIPVRSPPGSSAWFETQRGRFYPWKDYRDALMYLRSSTSPATLVANVLRLYPYPSINGPTGRLSPFRAESGICWMLLVPIDLEAEFAEALERATDAVVVWSPLEPRVSPNFQFDRLIGVIRKSYRLEARFGRIEIWRRIDSPLVVLPAQGFRIRDVVGDSSSSALPVRVRGRGRT